MKVLRRLLIRLTVARWYPQDVVRAIDDFVAFVALTTSGGKAEQPAHLFLLQVPTDVLSQMLRIAIKRSGLAAYMIAAEIGRRAGFVAAWGTCRGGHADGEVHVHVLPVPPTAWEPDVVPQESAAEMTVH